LRVTDSTWSRSYVGETLRVMALTSSIGTSKSWDHLAHSVASVALVLRRLLDAGADFLATGLASVAAGLAVEVAVVVAGVGVSLTATF